MYLTFSLPLQLNIMPFHDPLTDIYEVKGPLSVIPSGLFWFLANTIFYIFWINILLGLFNALPAIPLDGGFVFKDSVVLIGRNFTSSKGEKKLEKIANRLVAVSSFTVLGLILTTLFLPWLKPLFF
jgi:membrane-associated protease RseP (regulator of RpoE activity)